MFFSDKFDIWPNYWKQPLSVVLKKYYDYVDKNVYSLSESILIRELCMKQDSRDFSLFNDDELNQMVIVL